MVAQRCTRITDGGPEQTKGLQYLLSRMPHLEELGLARLKPTAPCVKALQFLDLTACSVIGYTLREIAMGCRQLRTLYLSSCRDVTDETIVAFTTNCLEMRALYLSGCSELTDAAVLSISKNCKKLNVLNVSGCNMITDCSLVKLVTECPELHTIYLANCDKITGKLLSAMLVNSMSMKMLELSGCDTVIATYGLEGLGSMHSLQALVYPIPLLAARFECIFVH